jgi:hypothetical protein
MAEPSRIAAALEYLGKLRRQIANTQGVAVPDDYGQRFGAPGEPVPSLNQVGQSVRGAAQRMTSLDAPASQGMGDTALDIAAGFTPLQYPQAARDFERSRRTGDKLGMGLATLAAVPVVGGVAKAAGEARAAVKAAQIDPSVVNQALGKEFPKIDETTGDFFHPENQSVVISTPNYVGNYGKNLNIERKVGNGKIRLTAKIEDMPFSDEPSRMTTALEALGDVPRGTGAATEMYLEALAIAQAQGVGFASESIRSNAAENIYRRLIKKGVPFKQGVGMDEGSWVLSADDLRRLDFSKLKDN